MIFPSVLAFLALHVSSKLSYVKGELDDPSELYINNNALALNDSIALLCNSPSSEPTSYPTSPAPTNVPTTFTPTTAEPSSSPTFPQTSRCIDIVRDLEANIEEYCHTLRYVYEIEMNPNTSLYTMEQFLIPSIEDTIVDSLACCRRVCQRRQCTSRPF
jgi:hypothetical protein